MKKLLKFIGGSAVALALATSFPLQAAEIGGVLWNPLAGGGFSASGSSGASWFGTASGAPDLTTVQNLGAFGAPGTPGSLYYQGVGIVNNINGALSGFCIQGSGNCQLIYTFGGLSVDPNSGAQGNPAGGAASTALTAFHNFFPASNSGNFTPAGFLNFYVYTGATVLAVPTPTDSGNVASIVTAAASASSSLWLGLKFDSAYFTAGGSAYSLQNGGLQVTGGSAAPAFIANSTQVGPNIPPLNCPTGPTLTAFCDTASLTFGATTGLNNPAQFNQNAITFSSHTLNVPEPGSIALMGLALLAVSATRRRKSA